MGFKNWQKIGSNLLVFNHCDAHNLLSGAMGKFI